MNPQRMHLLLGGGLLAWALLLAQAAAAASADAVVDALQMPAWVERLGKREALQPGLVLRNRDRVLTGPEGRVLIRLGDGSVLRLGAETRLDLNALGIREAVFTAAFDVPQGAVRFSTSTSARSHHQRAVNLRVGTITAGIRGTDVWGKADSAVDRICLLEGSITVVHPDEEARQISEASSCYQAAKESAATAIETVTAAQLSWWTQQTAMQSAPARASSPVMRDGKWAIELATLDSEAAALSLYDRARAAGYPVRIRPQALSGGGYAYAVRLSQLMNRPDAAALAEQVSQSLQIPSPVVVRH